MTVQIFSKDPDDNPIVSLYLHEGKSYISLRAKGRFLNGLDADVFLITFNKETGRARLAANATLLGLEFDDAGRLVVHKTG